MDLAIRTKLVIQNNLTSPSCVNERLVSIRIPLAYDKYLTVIRAYVPTMDSDEDLITDFYNTLAWIVTVVPARNKLILMEDFNARVSKDYLLWSGDLESYEVGN